MPDLSTNCAGITSPNPFWLASAPPANSGAQIQRAFDLGWGGAVWKMETDGARAGDARPLASWIRVRQ
ncbi:MAG: hypothetical protein ABI054_02315, partial [Planctomycetota bacterium]